MANFSVAEFIAKLDAERNRLIDGVLAAPTYSAVQQELIDRLEDFQKDAEAVVDILKNHGLQPAFATARLRGWLTS
jgi:hypothetical protein